MMEKDLDKGICTSERFGQDPEGNRDKGLKIFMIARIKVVSCF